MNVNFRLAVVTASWLLFVLACAGIIQGIEDSRDKSLRAVFDDDIRNFLDTVNSQKTELANNGNATSGNGKACLTEEDLMQFLYRVELPLKRSFLNKARLDDEPPMMEGTWFYRHSILFICAIVTTVGYGNIIPMTEAGKGFSVFVVLVGVPLTILYYYVWIEKLLKFTSLLNNKLYRAVRTNGASSITAKIVAMSAVLATAAICTILLPASFYYACEAEWSYLTAIYYCTLTLATAGLGDFVPMKSERCGDYVIVTAIYLVNVVFLTTFMLANLFDIYEIEDADGELAHLTSCVKQDSGDKRAERRKEEEKDEEEDDEEDGIKPVSPRLRDMYLSGLGR